MDPYIQPTVECTPLVGQNPSANVSLSPPSPQRKRRRTTLEEGLHNTEKSSELPYFLPLDQCNLPGSSPTIPSFTLKRRTIEYTATFQEDIDYSSYPRTTRKLQKEGLSFAGLQFPRLEHDASC
jgi:hypothetical protein